MDDPPPIGRTSRGWQVRLWHLAIAVLAMALLLALVHAARGENPEARTFGRSILIPLLGISGVAILTTPLFFAFRASDGFVRGLLDRGEHWGGLVGFATPTLVFLLKFPIGLAAILLGFVLMCAWFVLLIGLVGFD